MLKKSRCHRELPTTNHYPVYYPYNHPVNKNTRLQIIFTVLDQAYPNAHIALHFRTPWELLVAVMLSAQCTDVMVNTVTTHLFQKYPTLDAYCRTTLDTFEQDIKKTGFYRAKAKNILRTAQIIQTTFHGRIPRTMKEMLTLPGVARKTANVVLGNAYGIVEGIAVDTHVIRLSQRLRLVPIHNIGGKDAVRISKTKIDFYRDANPVKIEKALMRTVPKSRWFSITYQLIDHGRTLCKARSVQCAPCPLRPVCPSQRTVALHK